MNLFGSNIIKRKMSTVSLPWELIDNYTKDSTIHGVKYFAEKQRHWTAK